MGKEERYYEDVSKITVEIAVIFVEIKYSQIHHLMYFFSFPEQIEDPFYQ